MAHDLVCWRCGASLAALTLPLRRREECPACRVELHVCRMCVAWEPRLPRKCREQDAEEVKAKDTANFCDWFRPRSGAFDAVQSAAERQAQSALTALFGGSPAAPAPGAGSAADDLFAPDPRRKG